MTKQFVVRAVFFLCCVTGFSVAYAHSYLGGNGLSLSVQCNQEPPLEKNDYKDDRGVNPAEFCALDIIKEEPTVTQQPCFNDSNGIVSVTAIRGEGEFYFWWPSRGGTKDQALSNPTDITYWCRVDNPGTATIVLSKANGGFGFSKNDDELLVFSKSENLRQTLALTEDIKQWPAFAPGTITTYDEALCAGITIPEFGSAAPAAGGNGTYTYQWYVSTNSGTFTEIPGATSTTFSSTVTVPGTYIYKRLDADGQCNTAGSYAANEAKVVRYLQFTSGSITSDSEAICSGGTVTTIGDAVSATGGDGSITYEWRYAGTLSGTISDNSATLTPAETFTANAGIYTFTRWAKDGACSTTFVQSAGSYVLTVYNNFTPGTITAYDTTLCGAGATIPEFGSAAPATGGNGSYAYQWHVSTNGGTFTEISGATLTTHTPAETAPGTYVYKRLDADGWCNNTAGSYAANEAKLVIFPSFVPGTITSYTEAICEEGTALQIGSAATPTGGNGSYTYQWFVDKDNSGTFTEISGATLTTHIPTDTAPGTYIYKRLDASEQCTGGVYATSAATLVIAEQPVVTISASSSAICYGASPSTLTATVSKGLPGATYTYTWEKESYLGWDTLKVNPTSTTYVLPQQLAGSTKYRVSVKGKSSCSSAPSPEQTITVYQEFNPGTFTETEGSARVNLKPLSVISAGSLPVNGSGSYTYQWYKNGDAIPGATLTTYDIPLVDVTAVGNVVYTREVSDVLCGGKTITRRHTLHVANSRDLDITPVDTAVCDRVPYTLTVHAFTPATYTWYDSTATGKWKHTGANSHTLVVSGTPTGTYYYKVVIVTDEAFPGEVIQSSIAKVRVWEDFSPGAFIIGRSGVCAAGDTPRRITDQYVTPATGGSGSYTYQWYKNGLTEEYKISGATAATYQPPVSDTESGATAVVYRRIVTDDICDKSARTQGNYTLTIGEGGTYPEPISPSTLAVCAGDAITIAASKHSNGATYTWYETDAEIGSSDALTVPLILAGTHYYKVSIKEKGCDLVFTSEPATVTAYAPYGKGGLNGNGTTCVNVITPSAITGTAPTGGDGNYSYQWYKDGELITGATAGSYTPTAEDLRTAGTIKYVREEKDGSCATWTPSGTYTLTVQPSPTVQLTGITALPICNGGSFTLTAGTPTAGTATTYTWEHRTAGGSWAPVGALGATLTVLNNTEAGIHYYRAKVRVTTTCEVLLTTDEATITVSEVFSPGAILVGEGAACVGKQPQAITGVSEPTGGSGTYTYKWFENMTTEVGTAATYQPGSMTTPGVKVYSRQVADPTCNPGFQNTTGLFILTVDNGKTPTVDIVSVKSTICGGGNITLTAGTVTGGTYTWASSNDGLAWTTRMESTTNVISLTGATAAGDYYYKVDVSAGDVSCDNYTSVPATVTVRKNLDAGVFQVTEGAICPGEIPAAITGVSAATGGDGNYSYQWYKGGVIISGATAATYQPETFGSATTVVYTRGVKDASCQTSDVQVGSYTLTVSSAVTSTINIVQAVQDVCNGASFTVVSGEPATGAVNNGYMWSSSANGVDWNVINGQYTKTLSVSSGTLPGTYYYKVEVLTSGTCSQVVTSTPATVTVRKPFAAGKFIVPEGGVCVGAQPQAITGVTDPTGGSGNYTYEWYKNGTEIKGATGASYQPPMGDAVTPGKIVYTRKEADVTCATALEATAGSFVLNVGGAPTTNIVPASIAVCNNQPATLTAGLTAGTYTWQKSSNGTTWENFGSADRSVTTPATATGSYYYRVTVATDDASCNSYTSVPATVTVRETFTAGTFHVQTGAVCANEVPSAIYAGDPTGGSGNYTYQWYKDGTGSVNKITGATLAAYRPAVGGTGTYYREVTDASCGASTLTSGSYVLTIATTDPTTNLNPAVLSVCNGETITITTGAHAMGTYTWSESTNGTTWTPVTGQNNMLNVPGKTGAGTYYYKVEITGASTCGTITSTPSTVTVRGAFNAGTITAAGTICAGGTPAAIAETSPATGGDSNYSYRWYKDGQPIAGATAATYTPAAADVLTAGTVRYTREVKDGACATWTFSANTYTLTVTAVAATVTLSTPTVAACLNTDFSVAANLPDGGTANSYTWEEYTNGAWKPVTSTGSTQTLTVGGGKDAAGEYYYRAKVNVTINSDGCVTNIYSDAATVTVGAAFNAGSFTISEGAACVNMQPQAITAIASPVGGSGSYSYQWYKNGQPITDATAATYQPPVNDAAAAGVVVYTRQEADATCNVSGIFTLGSFTLKVGGTGSPTTNIVPDQTAVCSGSPFTLTAGTVTGAQTYTWAHSSDGTSWTGFGTNSSSATHTQTAPGSYYYKVTVSTSGAAGCNNTVISVPSTITVRETLKAGAFQVTSGAICPGATPAAITGVSDPAGGDGHYTYQWYKDGVDIPGATAAIYQPETFGSATTVVYTRGVKGSCSTSSSLATGGYTLTVSSSVTSTINLLPAVQGVCGEAFTVTSGTLDGAQGYTWYGSTDGTTWNLSGQTDKALTVSSGAAVGTYYYKVSVLTSSTCSPVVVSAPATVTVYGAFNAGSFLTAEGATWLNERPEAITGVSAPAGGSGSYTYQWYKDSQLIVNAIGVTYWPPVGDASAVSDVVYTRQVTDVACGNSAYTSGSYILKVGAKPTTNIIPVSTTVCNNTTFTLIAGVYSGTYSWTESTDGLSWQELPESTSTLTGTKSVAGVYYYNVTITTATGVIEAAAAATVTVHKELDAGAFQVTSGVVCAGEIPSTIYAGAPSGGSGNYTYQWYKGSTADGNKIAGAIAASYRPAAASATGTYYRKVTDATCGASTMTSGSYVLTEGTTPTTNLDPAVLTVCNGENIEITTDFYNGAAYIWEESADGSSYAFVPGQTNNILHTSTAVAGTRYYKVTVYNASACGAVTSTPATVTVREAFNAGVISNTAGSICVGGTAIIATTSATGGDGNYSYRWYKNGVLIAGATMADYTLKAEDVLTAGTAAYTREAKDGTCATWTPSSNTYTLTVTAAPTVTLQTSTVTACISSDFSVAVGSPSTGAANSYVWEEYVNGTWTNVSGTAQTLTVSGGKPVAGKYYYRAKLNVTAGGCTTDIYSNAATVTVREAFNAGVFQVTAGAICPGVTPAAITGVSAATGGDGNYTYQWYESGSPITGATAATYQPGTFSSAATAVYTRSAKDATCQTTEILSGSYTLTVSESITSTINIVPAVQEACNGAAFTVTSGIPAGATSYKWEASADGAAWREVTGVDNVLSISGGQSQAGEYYYRVTVQTSSTCSPVVVSTPATVTVREAFNPGVFQVPTGAICPGATPAAITGVSVATGGDGNYTYQWYKDGQQINGATAATYQPETFGSATTVVYTRGAKDGCTASAVTIGSYTLTVSSTVTSTINLVPAVQSVCAGMAFTVTPGEPAGALGYTWYSSADGTTWNPVSGQTTKVLTHTETATGSYYYKVSIQTSSTCSPVVVSAPATVTVYGAFNAGSFLTAEGATWLNERPEAITGVSAPAGGSGSYTYKWYKEGEEITGATGSIYWPPVSDASTVGNVVYTRQVTDVACGNSAYTSGSYVLKVGANPTTNIIPVSTAVCNNAAFTLIAGVYSGTYSWTESTDGVDWKPISGTTNVLAVPAKPAAGVYYYNVEITTATGVIKAAAPATVTVREAFSAGVFHITSGVVCAGEIPSTIYAGAPSGGSGNYTYQWYKDDTNEGNKITGAMAASYQPAAGGAGTYYRSVTDATCSTSTMTSGNYVLTEGANPTTNLNPAVLSVCAGGAIEIGSGSYSGGIYIWEWSADGSSYTVVNGQSSDVLSTTAAIGTHYYKVSVLAASSCGNITSTPATVTVYDVFSAGAIATSGTICAGGVPATIAGTTPVTGGDGNYSYRWYKEGVLIGGATAATYTPAAADVLTAGTVRYTREVKDGACATWTISADTYTLTVTAVTATVTLSTPTVAACLNTDFSVAANSPVGVTTANSYTWEEYTNGAWNPVAGSAQTLTVGSGKNAAGEYYYRAKVNVTISDGCVTNIYSDAATVTVGAAFNPGEFLVDKGSACLDVQPQAITGVSNPTGGSGSYSYQWYESGSSITGATAATYQPETFGSATTVVYTREVIDQCGTLATAGSFTLEVGGATMPTTDIVPVNTTVCNNEAVTLTAGVANASAQYKWENSRNGETWTDLTQTTKDLQVSGQTATGAYYYRVTVTTTDAAPCNIITSTPATVTVRAALSAGEFIVPAGAICVGALPAAISGNVTDPAGGDGNYTYRWYKGGQLIPGATAATYQPETFSGATTVAYTRGVKDGSCSTTSYTFATGSYTLTVGAAGTQTTNLTPAAQGICGGSFSITAVEPADALGYTWEKSNNGTVWNVVSGQNTKVLGISGLESDTYYYKVTVLSAGTCAPVITSTPATVTVYADFTPGTFSGSTFSKTCINVVPSPSTSASVSVPTNGSGTFTYQWYKNGVPISGATDDSYQFTSKDVTVAGAYTYTREVVDAVCSGAKFSAGSYILVVDAAENVTTTLSASSVCYGESFTIEAALNSTVTATSYTWERSENSGATWTPIPDATSATLTVSPATVSAQYRVIVDVQDVACKSISSAVTVVVGEPFTPGTITTAQKVMCLSGTPEEIASEVDAAGGLGNNTYQWYEGSTVISDATSATYTPAPASTGTFVYTRKVENTQCGKNEYSAGTYTLQVVDAPVVTVKDTISCSGGAVSLTAEVTGESSAATYNWQYNNGAGWTGVQNGAPANATYTESGQTLTISGITTAGTYNYRVQMLTGLSGCDTIGEAKLTIVQVPVGGTVTVGATEICATLPTTLTLTGAQGTTIAWYERNGSGNWTPISGATATQIQVAPATAGTWHYMAVVSNSGCSSAASSTIGQLYVKSLGKGGHIDLTGEPYLCVGQSRTMNLTEWEGDLQWQRSGDGVTFVNVAGATSDSYTSGTLTAGTYQYRVRATMPTCVIPVYSDTLELRVYAKSQGGAVVAAGTGATSITMCFGSTAPLTLVSYIGESFRWISQQQLPGSTYIDLGDGNSATYTLSSQLSQGTYNIRVIVDAGCGPDTSSAMQVVVKAPLNVTLSVDGAPAGTTELPAFCKGHELVLKVNGLPTASTTWTGTITAGTATSTYIGTGNYWRVNTAAVQAPGTYTYEVTYADEFCTPSHAGPITVNYLAAPDVGTLTSPVTEFCNEDQGSYTLTLSGTGTTNIEKWEWKSLDSNPGVNGWDDSPSSWNLSANSHSATVTQLNVGVYAFRVVVSDSNFGACSLTYSNEVQVIKYNVPTIAGGNESYTSCEKVDVNHTFTGSAGATFKWKKTLDGEPAGTGTGAINNDQLVWSGNTATNAPQTVTYTVTPVIGTKACEGTPKTITYILMPPHKIIFDETNSIIEVSCYDAKEGKLIYTTVSPSTFTLFKDGQRVGLDQTGTAATFTGLGMGTYTLEVNNGTCIITRADTITGPAHQLVIINDQSSDATCYGESMGVITFEVEGGTAPYKASINNGAYVDTTSFSGLAAGVYSVKVQDAKGCITEKNITVGQNPQLTLTVTAITPVSAAGAHDATATLQPTGGSGSNYRYSATGLSNDFSTRNVIGGLSEGLNYVYAKDGNGCMVSVPVQIGAYPTDGGTVTISLTAVVTKPLTCDAASDAEITAQAFGGNSPYQYSKDDGATWGSSVLTGFSAGVHTITVKDNANRMATIDVTVSPAVPLTFTATITKPLSVAGNDAEVTLNITGNPAAFDYSKDNLWVSSNVFGGLGAQTYAFTVRYKNPASCEATPIIVGIPGFASSTDTPHVGITASITRALLCEGNVNAEITVTASGGNGTYSFTNDDGVSWTTSSTATVHVFDGLSAGMYNMIVQSGTENSSTITLEVKSAVERPVINAVTPTATTCGNSNGSINVTATGGVGALEYSLSGIRWSYSNSITGLNAGNYNVLVKDGRGCTSNPTAVTVAATPPVTFEVTSVTPASTPAAENGQIALTIAGGQPSYDLRLDGASTYVGRTTSTTYTISSLQAGLYTLTVTDANGCVAIKNVLVGAIEPGTDVERISVTYTTQDPTCHSAADGQITVTARGGSGTYTYSLDDKTYGTSNVFTGLLAGTYVVYVKDNATPAQKVYVPNVVLKGKEALSFTAAVVQSLSSAGASDAAILITAKGGTAPYTYTVNGGSTNNSYVSGLSAGDYAIVVADANGCSVSGTIRITKPVPEESPRPAVSVSLINDPSCFGGNDGTIAVTASGGRAPYAYSVNQVNWTTNNTITGLAAGTYTVYVKELSLDRITEGPTVELGNPARLTASAVMTAAITAPGAADGAVRVIATGGTQSYQYSIDAQNTYQYGDAFTGLQAQLYTFYVKDGKGCVATTNILLAEPGKITISPQITKPVSCYGAANAEITITASGGTAPYQYQWDGTSAWSNSATLTGVSAGVHTIFVKDNAGNTASLQMFIPQPMMLTVTAQVTALPTGNKANGAIAITASGGSGNYTYKVGSGTYSVAAVGGLTTGNYTIEITDGNGCTASTTIYLGTVDVVVNKTVINLQKGHVSETYTVRLTSAPQGDVTVGITGPNDLLTITPSSIVFTPGNWDEREVGVTIAPGVGSPVGGVTYFTTKVQNSVVSAPSDPDYMNITREVIVNITDDGGLNCTDFESDIPLIAVNGDLENSPFAICTSDNIPYVLTTSKNGSGITYRWLKDKFLEVSTAASHLLTESGTYTVTVMNDKGCMVVSEPFAVSMESAPDVPVIVGERIVREGQEKTYEIKDAQRNINYKWVIPSGYSLGVGSFDDDPRITMRVGSTSSILRVLVTNRSNSNACAGVEGRLNIEVRSSYAVDVFPTVASNGAPLRIIPKNMVVNSIAVINTVGESYPYRILSGKLALVSGEEMQIIVNGLSSGHYFIVFYGREQSVDGNYNGKSVVHTEHVVIKN